VNILLPLFTRIQVLARPLARRGLLNAAAKWIRTKLKRTPRAAQATESLPGRQRRQALRATHLQATAVRVTCRGRALLAGLLLGFSITIAGAQQNLPIMGEPADAALSPIEERELGAQFMRQIRVSLPLIRDVQLNEYIQDLGSRLVMGAANQDTDNFHFFIINDPQINAFAIPGGYVGVNSGLIDAMAMEDQLASVIAHEVAHVTQRHHARAYATGNRASISAAAAILAAIIIGQASPQAGQAALAAGLAASQQSAINFTRTNEIEADRIGIEILANASYNPRAMAESFDILRRKNSLNTSSLQLEYLRTHPLDNNRIAEATDRASAKPATARNNSLDYRLFRARLAVLSSTDKVQTLREYKAQHARNPQVDSYYAIALLHYRNNRPSQALRFLSDLDNEALAHPMVQLLQSQLYHDASGEAGNKRKAEQMLESLSSLYPERYSIIEQRLEFLIEKRRLTEARHVASRYIRDSDNPRALAWHKLASIQQQLNDDAGSHESLARYFAQLGELGLALSQLQLALREVSPGSQDQIRLEARLRGINQRVSRIR